MQGVVLGAEPSGIYTAALAGFGDFSVSEWGATISHVQHTASHSHLNLSLSLSLCP